MKSKNENIPNRDLIDKQMWCNDQQDKFKSMKIVLAFEDIPFLLIKSMTSSVVIAQNMQRIVLLATILLSLNNWSYAISYPCDKPFRLCTERTFSTTGGAYYFNEDNELYIEYYSGTADDYVHLSFPSEPNSCGQLIIHTYGPLSYADDLCSSSLPVFNYSSITLVAASSQEVNIEFENSAIENERYLIKVKFLPCGNGFIPNINVRPKIAYCPGINGSECHSAFPLQQRTQNNFTFYDNFPYQLWSAIIVDPGENFQIGLQLAVACASSNIANENCLIHVYGPFNNCESICEIIAQQERLVYESEVVITTSTASILNQNNFPVMNSVGWFYIHFAFDGPEIPVSSSTPACPITLSSDGNGILNEFPASPSNGMTNSYASVADAVLICDESGSINLNINNGGSDGEMWMTFIAGPESNYEFVYNENTDGICAWNGSQTFDCNVYGPFASCTAMENIVCDASNLLYQQTLDPSQTYEDYFFTNNDIPDIDYHARYMVKIHYPLTFCNNCVVPIGYSTFNLACDWSEVEEEAESLWSTCEGAYHFCNTNYETINFEQHSQNPPEIWLSFFLSSGTGYPEINYSALASNNCFNGAFNPTVDVFGPFNECGNPCDLLANSDMQVLSYSPTINPQISFLPFSTVLNNNILPLLTNEPQKFFVRILIDESACGPCNMGIQLKAASDQCMWPLPTPDELPCEDCLPPYSLQPGEPYVITAWVKVANAELDTKTYASPPEDPAIVSISIVNTDDNTVIGVPFQPTGPIIEGWQQITGVFEAVDANMGIMLNSVTLAYFDDIRVFPDKGSMKCYVYDPINLRFVAELDERHFATYYEYDEEGRLARIKKETERGIMTIQETRTSSPKK
jgi:hypothetical protein